jgi:lipopolysaccharide/colanic/teichoic acid biosynthesis glycosyltransferase/glycosyltransferase involved in cell wall biosynthesis
MTNPSSSNNRLLIAVTSPLACNFYKGVLGHLKRAGFEPTVMSAPGEGLRTLSAGEKVPSLAVPMKREIAPVSDAIALLRIYRRIRKLRPYLVDASTPKAGLLVSIAAWIARVPCRVYTLRGLRLETTTGAKRAVLWTAEWISCACSHKVICVSASLRTRANELGFVSPRKATAPGKGSGIVDPRRFFPRDRHSAATTQLRESLGIPDTAPVVGFVGRFVRDKGIGELVEAFRNLRTTYPDLHLLLVGDFEDGDPVKPEVRRYIESEAAIIRPGFVADSSPYYGLMDLLALPTYREGFPGVPLEAQASGVPVVTTSATGAIDSVVDPVTGLIVPVGDAKALTNAIARLLKDPELRARMGKAGRLRVEQDFVPQVIWDAKVALYRDLMVERSLLFSPAAGWPKRFFDLTLSVLGLLLLSPLLLIIAAIVKTRLGSPILFRQERAGFRGVRFECLKFRTMTDERDASGQLLPDADRLTRLGRFLRDTSLDELPELINVIRGEMSLVGPRPLLARYLERYTPEQMRRHDVRPGITGWAQINGRNAASWEQKFACDLWYVEHQSLRVDLKILLLTIWKAVRREGISQPGHPTMPEFMGAQSEIAGNWQK